MTFTELRRGALVYTAAPALGAPHAFTTRLGGVDTGDHASLNLGRGRTDDPRAVRENLGILCAALGLDPERVICRRQVHGTRVDPVTEADVIPFDAPSPEADGLMTDRPGLALLVFTADCVPLLLHDPVRGAVAALHAGWRGSVADMAGAGVRAMEAAYGCRPEHILAAVGPSIGPCCFEAGPEVKEAALDALGVGESPLVAPRPFGPGADPAAATRPGKCFVDLKGLNRALLLRAGLRPEHIALSPDCTRCRPDRYWSYRLHGNRRGSQGAVIALPR